MTEQLPATLKGQSTGEDIVSEMKPKLTPAEEEFISEMELEHDYPGSEWHSFDPDFRQMDIIRLFKRGWFERRGSGRDRSYRWTDAGRAALVRVPDKDPAHVG